MISLLSFVQTGLLGSIGLDSSSEAVQSALVPAPSWDAESQFGGARIWKDGAMGICFEDHHVWMIFTDDFHTDLHMGAIAFDANGIYRQMTLEQMEAWLSSHTIASKRVEWPWCDEGACIETTSGVTFTFCAEEKSFPAFLCSLALVRR